MAQYALAAELAARYRVGRNTIQYRVAAGVYTPALTTIGGRPIFDVAQADAITRRLPFLAGRPFNERGVV